jgi:hypothetical protein
MKWLLTSFDFPTALSNIYARLDRIDALQSAGNIRLAALDAGRLEDSKNIGVIMSTVQDEKKMQTDTQAQVAALGATLATMAANVASEGSTISALNADATTAAADFKAWIATLQTGQPLDLSVGLAALSSLQAANAALQTASDSVKAHGDSLTALAATITQADPGAPPQPVAAN